jgi:hypothetical protein
MNFFSLFCVKYTEKYFKYELWIKMKRHTCFMLCDIFYDESFLGKPIKFSLSSMNVCQQRDRKSNTFDNF